MSKVRVLELDSVLPVYVLQPHSKSLNETVDEVEIHSFEVDFEKRIEDFTNQQQEVAYDADSSNVLEWLNDQKEKGSFGEKLAFAYLYTMYQDVVDVSLDAKKGYDIEIRDAGIIGVEVKTSETTLGFHITINEIKKAYEMQDDHYLFFIYVHTHEKEITGYLIKNFLKVLNIDFREITKQHEFAGVKVIPNKFFISFNRGFLKQVESIDLTSFASKIS